jgi:hypothetical protein
MELSTQGIRTRRVDPQPLRALAGAVLLLCSMTMPAAQDATIAAIDEERRAARLLVVDCLLPGQVRQLGTGVTYLAPRRAIKTTGEDCAIRGGEYVAYDRANHASALKAWLPAAQGGDKVAQTYVGEIYEKGLGIAPDYAAAASWYRKAADQGHSRALIALGFLYEQGLGVPRDPATALQLYRKAAGIQGSINLDGPVSAPPQQELDALRRELERTRQELDAARRALDQERLRSGQEIERLTKQKIEAAAAGRMEESRRLEAQLAEREAELEKRRQQVAQFERSTEDYRARLARVEGESAALREELVQARRLLAQSQREIDERRAAAAEAERRLEAMQQELARQKNAPAPIDPVRIQSLERELEQSRAEYTRQKQDIARLEADVGQYKDKVAKLEARPEPPKPVVAPAATITPAVTIAPPSIQIIDPPVVVTRDSAAVTVRSGVTTRPVVGRVTAPAGLLSFTVNDAPEDVDSDGYFRTNVSLSGGRTRLTVVAVDRQGRRSLLEFYLEPEALPPAAPVVATPRMSAQTLGLGKFHALVIGNQHYEKLPPLNTPEADAGAIAELLRERYGFTVTLLLNGTRWAILEEINKLRGQLTERDSLLIYYAGHGEIDRVNAVANWLPIDADPKSNANWIAASTLTENLNMIAAKHILVVADSCYSGAMTRSSIGQLQSGMTDEERNNWLKSFADKKSRTVLTSGGVSPVMDGGGGKHSVFAKNFIDALTENSDPLLGTKLWEVISARVLNVARRMKFEQRPDYAPIRFTDHDAGDFIFVPKA